MSTGTAAVATSIPLREAALCIGCERVFALREHVACPSCTGTVVMPLARITDRPRNCAPIADVLHHAGNGLTPARVYAERLADTLAARQYPGWAQDARRIVQAIDQTLQRLRTLPSPPPSSWQGVFDGR